MNDCIFCKIIKGEIPVKPEYEDENIFVFNSNKPEAEVHLLILPKRHVTSFMDLDDQILDMTKAAQKIIKDKNLISGYRLIINGGNYQEVPHVHLHLLAGKIDS